MKKYLVRIVGKTPYMQDRMDDVDLEKWEKTRGKIIERNDIAKEDLVRAEYHMYRDVKPYIPSEQIRAALINAGSYLKSKVGNSKKSMKNIVAAMFYVSPEKIYLDESWIIDKRSAVNRIIKARIMKIRPKWEKWDVTFQLDIDNDTLTDETIKEIIQHAGNYCGIGSFRPTNNGMFGRFELVEFKEY